MTQKTSTILDNYPAYEATIGIEVHVQLKTNSKIFCGCPNQFGDEPNTNICPICCGHPGTLPALNKKVVDFAVMAGLATNCLITKRSKFARKHYIYPDLPKNYQTTQGEQPICIDGHLSIQTLDGAKKKVGITRIHMEEDAGKNIHIGTGKSWIDLNRAGTPLLEIVSEPDIANAHEAKEYLNKLHTIVRYLGISDANMEQGSFRADVNISVKKKEATKLGTRAEIKNVNSFKFIGQAIDYEIQRQIEMLEAGEVIRQETRLWDSKKQQTLFMRLKGNGDDYRYFTDPDLPIIEIDENLIENINKQIPELPHHKSERFQKEYGLSSYETDILTGDKVLSAFFEESAKLSNLPKQACNWILRDLLGYLKEEHLEISQTKITPRAVAELVIALDKDIINSKAGQEVFTEMITTGKGANQIITEKGLEQMSDTSTLEKIVLDLIEKNPETAQKVRDGNDRMMGFFVGQSMKATQGKGNPKIIQELLQKHLK